MGRQSQRKNGFTVVELILVVVVIAILTIMFVPHYTKDAILKHKVYATAHELASDLRYARQLSMGGGLQGNPVTAPSSAENPVYYWLEIYKSTGAATDSWRIYPMSSGSGSSIKTVTTLSDIELVESSTPAFYFDKNGAPLPSTNAYIEVRDITLKYRWAVSVVRTTGQIVLNEIQ